MGKNASDTDRIAGRTDKRREANLRVKTNITEALFALMHEKSISEITVTELIKKAGVARASYYRNYDSKEDVLLTLVEYVLNSFREEADYDLTNYRSQQNVLRAFQYFDMYGKYVLDLYQSGLGTQLLEVLNLFHEDIAGTMSVNSIDRYKLYIFMGALFNTALMWLRNGKKESAEDMAAAFCRYIGME